MSWFSNIVNQANDFADGLANSLVAQVSVAQDEILLEQKKLKNEEELKKNLLNKEVLLPWETTDETKDILSQSLMEDILQLSLNDNNFLIKPPYLNEVPFIFSNFIPVIMRLLKLDANLAKVHAKLSPKMDEEIFWQHYYVRIMFLRTKIGIENNKDITNLFLDQLSEDVIFLPDINISVYNNKKETSKVNNDINNNNNDLHHKYKSNSNNDSDEDIEIDIVADARLKRQISDALLAAEVQAELDNEDDNEDDLDIDLNDLDLERELEDLDPLDDDDDDNDSEFEKIGTGESLGNSLDNDDEGEDLEAQIAKELNSFK